MDVPLMVIYGGLPCGAQWEKEIPYLVSLSPDP